MAIVIKHVSAICTKCDNVIPNGILRVVNGGMHTHVECNRQIKSNKE